MFEVYLSEQRHKSMRKKLGGYMLKIKGSGWISNIAKTLRNLALLPVMLVILVWSGSAAAAITITMTSSANPASIGQRIPLVITVSGVGSLNHNWVNIFVDSTSVAQIDVQGSRTVYFPGIYINSAGAHTLSARYGSMTPFIWSTPFTQTIIKTSATTTLATSSSLSVVGQAGTLTATVAGATVAGTLPTGTVTFMDGATVLGSAAIAAGQAILSTTFRATGSHSLTAVYGGDGNNTTSTSAAVLQTVNPRPTTTTLASSANPSSYGAAITLTATVAGYSPTGTVTFKDGATVLGTGTITAGQATFSAAFSTAGAHSLTANYSGDTNNTTSNSSVLTQTVNQSASTTTLTASPNPSIAGQAITLSAAVTGATPGGTVTFMDGATVLGSSAIVAGQASLNAIINTAGTHSLTASYAGDVNNAASSSAAVSQTINIAASSTALTATPNPSAAGQAVTLTATVAGALPTGTVTFMDGATVLGTSQITAGNANLNYTFATSGAHNLTASYAGDANNANSISSAITQTINVATSTTVLSALPNPAVTGQTVTLTASVTGALPTGTVTFMDGATVLGTGAIAAGRATLGVSFSTVGMHSLTANYAGDANNAASTSTSFAQTVQSPSTTALTATPNPSIAGQTITLTASVTGSAPNGTVTFMDGATVLGTGAITAGQATLNATINTAGVHNLTARYAGDANNAASTSTAISQTVTIATSSTALTTTPNPSVAGQATTLTAAVAGVLPSGTVTFMDGATVLGTSQITAGSASLSYTFATAGAHSLTASYAGDANNATSTSAAVAQTVNVAASITVLRATPNPAAANQIVALSARVTGALPTGIVAFTDGMTVLGTGTLAAGTATLNTGFSVLGAHSLTASYAGDANHTSSTSAAITVTVGADQITYYHNDIAGTPMAATDANGALLWKESYRPYGDPMQQPLAADNNIWFTGKPYDKDSGLTYMGARYYDPLIGRFTGIDPVGFKEDNIHSFNRYAYANNNPNKFVDPDGRWPLLLTHPIAQGAATAGGLYHPAAAPSSSSTDYPAELQLGSSAPPSLAQQMANNIGGFIGDVIKFDELIISAVSGDGKSRNKPPEALPEAEGRPHSIIERPGQDGQYTTHNGDGTWKQYRGSGGEHGGIPRPNVKEAGTNITPEGKEFVDKGRVRPASPSEIPGG